MMSQLASAPKGWYKPKWHMGKVALASIVDDILNLHFRDALWMSRKGGAYE